MRPRLNRPWVNSYGSASSMKKKAATSPSPSPSTGHSSHSFRCHCGYKGHGLLIFCWSWRCNCSPTQDMTTTHRFKYQTTWIKGLHDEKKSIVLFVVQAVCNAPVKAPMGSN